MSEQKPKIVISLEVKKELDDLGNKNDTYNDVIKRLILFFKNKKRTETIKDKSIYSNSHLR